MKPRSRIRLGGHDFTGFWCRAGSAASCTPEGLPGLVSQPGPGYGDSIGAMTLAGGIAAALLKRERTGEPSVVDVSLLGTGIFALGQALAISLQTGKPFSAPPLGGHAAVTNPLVGTYRTRDGRWISLVMLQAFHYWPDFCEHVERSDLIRDPRFDSAEKLAANAGEAVALLRDAIASKPLAEWTRRFETLRESYFEQRKKIVKRTNEDLLVMLTDGPERLEKEARARAETTLANMREKFGYCERCAKEAVSLLIRKRYAS